MTTFTVWVSSDSNKGRGASNRASLSKSKGSNLAGSDSGGIQRAQATSLDSSISPRMIQT